MELSERLVQVKSTAKEEDLPEYTPDDIVFLFGDVIRPVGLILNHNDPCVVSPCSTNARHF